MGAALEAGDSCLPCPGLVPQLSQLSSQTLKCRCDFNLRLQDVKIWLDSIVGFVMYAFKYYYQLIN